MEAHLYCNQVNEDFAQCVLFDGNTKQANFNRDGEAAPGLVEARDSRMSVNTGEKRRERQDLVSQAHPQSGVDALKGKFPRQTTAIPSVVDLAAAH